ncbi:hypothetical protein OXPF_25990 [Oxobacter pfennigii]|uniref:DUF2680 domain-containing protein n=1 Tax=Oxobacter pfennigii TaxID=36849 RepID=A0A0P8W7J1_9CLOT|nr:DUF2680 domain-containing protein [Oxobacter pfennigii]KPU43739.1 hypothetical protein OXPF_25990 [Oxobacter pfennigii]
MRRKICYAITAAILTVFVSSTAALAAEEKGLPSSDAPKINQQVKLTDAQKNELKAISEKMYELKKEMIKKYSEFGIITKEQAEKKLKRLEEIQKKIEENGYMPMQHKNMKKYDKDKHDKETPKKDCD